MKRLHVASAASLVAFALVAPFRAAAATVTPQTSVALFWTATGDDSLDGRASSYDLRVSTAPITEANFGSAVRWTAVMLPSTAGTRDSAVVTGLQASTTYWFALKVGDEVPNWSGISNVLSVRTADPPDVTAPAAVRDLGVGP